MCWRAWQVFPEGDENDALSSHPSSAEENKNEEPACEANWCRSRGVAIARETGTAVTVNAATTSGHGATAIAKDARLMIWRGRPKRRNQRSPEPRAIRTGRHQLEMRLPEATPARVLAGAMMEPHDAQDHPTDTILRGSNASVALAPEPPAHPAGGPRKLVPAPRAGRRVLAVGVQSKSAPCTG